MSPTHSCKCEKRKLVVLFDTLLCMNTVYIDVREPSEFASGHVAGALNIPLSELQTASKQLKKVPKDSELVVYCRSGGRAASAISFFESLGYKKVKNGINQQEIVERKRA